MSSNLTNINYYAPWCNPNINQLKAKNIEADALTVDTVNINNLNVDQINLPNTNQGLSDGVIKIAGNNLLSLYDQNSTKTNLFFGINAGAGATGGFTASTINNIAIGRDTLRYCAGNTVNNVVVGNGSLNAGATGPAMTGANNVIVGNFSGRFIRGSNSTLIGYGAASNTTQEELTALGSLTLLSNTTGQRNTALGTYSMTSNVTGNFNTATGYNCLEKNTTGSENSAYGLNCARNNTFGNRICAFGNGSLSSNTIGNDNTAFGYTSLLLNTDGNNNTACGSFSLVNAVASNNTALGYNSLRNVTTGANNIAIGNAAGITLTTGNNNIYIGNVGNTATEINHIRLGTPGSHTDTYIAGIVYAGRTATNTEGLRLLNNTASYSPSVLNYYEELNNVSITYSGAISATTATNKLTRIGRIVTLTLSGVNSAFVGANLIQANVGSIPARFAPTSSIFLPVFTLNNNNSSISIVEINPDGSFIFSVGAVTPAAYNGPGNCGIISTTLTYSL